MKISKTVNVPAKPAKKATPARTKKVEEIVCDFCQANLPNHGGYGTHYKCGVCKRDICQKHTRYDGYDDYPDNYCITCFDLRFVKYVLEWGKMIDRHEKEEEKFLEMIKKESLDAGDDIVR